MSYVVTGASGFVGGHLLKTLAAGGVPTLAVARGPIPVLPPGMKSATVKDYRETPVTRNATVIHLAESANTAAQNADHARQIEVVSTLLNGQPKRFVYLSSAQIYGVSSPQRHQPDETVHPERPYAIAKLSCERLVLAAGGLVLRASNLYGPGMARDNVMSDVMRQFGQEGPVRVRSAAPVREYLWIEDAVDAITRGAASRLAGCFNMGSGTAISVAHLVRKMLAIVGEDHRSVLESAPVDSSVLTLDSSRTRQALDWNPKVGLDEGLRRLIQGAA